MSACTLHRIRAVLKSGSKGIYCLYFRLFLSFLLTSICQLKEPDQITLLTANKQQISVAEKVLFEELATGEESQFILMGIDIILLGKRSEPKQSSTETYSTSNLDSSISATEPDSCPLPTPTGFSQPPDDLLGRPYSPAEPPSQPLYIPKPKYVNVIIPDLINDWSLPPPTIEPNKFDIMSTPSGSQVPPRSEESDEEEEKLMSYFHEPPEGTPRLLPTPPILCYDRTKRHPQHNPPPIPKPHPKSTHPPTSAADSMTPENQKIKHF